jgi:hypothetical protein
MDKLHLARTKPLVFNSRSGCLYAVQLPWFETKLPNLKLKARSNQHLGFLLLDITHSA